MGYFSGEPAPPYTPVAGQQIPQPNVGFMHPHPPTPNFGPSPPQGFGPSPHQQQQVPVVQVVQIHSSGLRGESTRITCPSCRADINTRVRYETGRMTHIAALLLCLIGCWPCACIPYCTEGCMDAEHECPNCNTYIGGYRR